MAVDLKRQARAQVLSRPPANESLFTGSKPVPCVSI